MWRGPGSFPPDPGEGSSTPAATSGLREGKFTTLASFFSTADEGLQRVAHYAPATQAELAPGSIIHIKDNKAGVESRIHNRVMLVVRTNAPVSMTCYSFCKHDPPLSSPNDSRSHWLVYQTGTPPQAENPAGLQPLEAYLHYGLSPKSDITINLRDPWNVEYEVEIAKLGNLTSSAYKAVRCCINELFCDESPGSPMALEARRVAVKKYQGGTEMKKSKSAPGEGNGQQKSPKLVTVKPNQGRRPSETVLGFRWHP